MLKEQRLPHQLRVQTQQIDKVLHHQQMPSRVSGGVVTPKAIHFNLQSQFSSGLERLRELKEDLLTALGVSDVQLRRHDGQWQLQINRPTEPPVALLELITLLPELEPAIVTLGLSEEGHPVLLDLTNEDLAHMLIVGESGAGKTTLLRSIAVSLALTNKQSQLQLVVINADKRKEKSGFTDVEPLSYLPHLLEPVASDLESCVDLLQFLVHEMNYRLEQAVQSPMIVVLIDHLVTLLEVGSDTVTNQILQLMQKGSAAGIHLIMSTSRPESPVLTAVFKSSIPVRLVGRMPDEESGLAVTGNEEVHPEYLYGAGDFIAVTSAGLLYFQAAFIGDYDLHLTLDTLHRRRPRPLLAKPLADHNSLHQQIVEENKLEEAEWFQFTPEGQLSPEPSNRRNDIVEPESGQFTNDDEIPFDAGVGWHVSDDS